MSPMISQSKAIKLAVLALTERRRRFYVAGEAAYQKGHDFDFAIRGHKHYTEHTEAIRQLENLEKILADHILTGAEEMPEGNGA